jgi:phytoene dehydrogenase-like protein
MPKQPISRDKRIAIVGAGPAGLSTALFLSKNGYHNVTVFEKLGRIGGLCDSITVDGMSFDLGANYVTWAYKETLKIAKEFGATTYQEKPYTSILVSPDGKVTYRDVVKAILHNPFTNKDISIWALIVAAIRYTRLRWKLGPVINPPDALERIDEHPELCVPFKQWLETNHVDDLGTLFEIPITVMGYGQLADIAAPYALRYLPLKTFLPMLLVRIPILGLLFPWPRRFSLGFQRLWERV